MSRIKEEIEGGGGGGGGSGTSEHWSVSFLFWNNSSRVLVHADFMSPKLFCLVAIIFTWQNLH